MWRSRWQSSCSKAERNSGSTFSNSSSASRGTVSTVQQIELTLTQGDLAGLLCASRQRINGALRQLQALGILGCSHGRIEVLQPQRLGDVASGKLVLCTSGG